MRFEADPAIVARVDIPCELSGFGALVSEIAKLLHGVKLVEPLHV